MAHKHTTARYRYWYAKLISLYPKPYRMHFGESMVQTFNDLLRERQAVNDKLFKFVLRIFFETSAGIIKENITFMIMQNITKSLTRAGIGTGLILLIPLALQFTIGTGVDGQGWNWKLDDFVIIGALLFVTGLAIDFAMRKLTKPAHRVVAVTLIVLLLIAVWVHLAVGIVDSWPFAGS